LLLALVSSWSGLAKVSTIIQYLLYVLDTQLPNTRQPSSQILDDRYAPCRERNRRLRKNDAALGILNHHVPYWFNFVAWPIQLKNIMATTVLDK
jgi:hypothetical protein